jgi:flagellar hook-length control protein FliK
LQPSVSFQQAVVAAAQMAGRPDPPSGPVPDEGSGLDHQMVQAVHRLWRGGAEEMRVSLRPEYLGALTIALRVEKGAVTAVLHVDEPQVRAWVQTHESLLREALSAQGLTLARLVVTDDRPGSESHRRDGDARQSRRQTRHREGADPGPTFEVAA